MTSLLKLLLLFLYSIYEYLRFAQRFKNVSTDERKCAAKYRRIVILAESKESKENVEEGLRMAWWYDNSRIHRFCPLQVHICCGSLRARSRAFPSTTLGQDVWVTDRTTLRIILIWLIDLHSWHW